MTRPSQPSADRRALLELLLREEGLAPAPQQGVARRAGDEPAPLSFAQQRLWFLDRLQPGNPFYNVAGKIRLSGLLDVLALERGLSEVVRRHEALRTAFVEIDGQARQVVRAHEPLRLERLDLTGLPEDRREAEVRRLADAEAARPFELQSGRLLRAGLLALGPREHVLLLTVHHIATDDWSSGVLVRELGALYAAFAQGRPSPLGELPLQFGDYAAWQREWLAGERLSSQLDYWRERLAGLGVLQLHGDRPRPAVRSHRGSCVYFTVPEACASALRSLARAQGATLFMVLLAGFKALLARYTGQHDIGLGSAIANRTRVEIEGLIGFFVNTLVLRTDLAGDPSFVDLLARVRATTLDAYAHQDLPFERLVEELQPGRDTSVNPLFQVAFVLQNSPAPPLELPGLTLSVLPAETGTAKFDLALSMEDGAHGLTGMLEYGLDLFDHATVEALVEHLLALLAGAARAPERRLSELPLLGAAERRRLIEAAAGPTLAVAPGPASVPELVRAQALARPDALALIGTGERVTYGQLEAAAERLALRLRGLGVAADARVAVCLERTPRLVEAQLAVLKSGAAYVPIDPGLPLERLAAMLAHCGAGVLLSDSQVAERLPPFFGRLVCLDEPARDEAAANLVAAPPIAPEQLAYVIYTSGSTGTPKGVAVSHAGLSNLVAWHRAEYALRAADRGALVAGLGFDASVWELWPYLAAGASLALPAEETRLAPRALLAWLREQQVTVAFLPTPLAELALQHEWPQELKLRALLTGGDALRRRPERALPCAFVNHYGPTENSVVATCGAVTALAELEPHERGTAPHIGRAIANVSAHALDARLEPVPDGVPGELYVGGDGLARGYLGDPALTAERFVPSPFGPAGARLYRTGDLVRRRRSGELEFVARADRQVKLRGFRIEPGEIELALNRHEAVAESAVLLRGGAEDARLVAYVVPRREGALAAGWRSAYVERWRELYDETYSTPRQPADAGFDIVGWNSSFSGAPIPEAEMREWAGGAVARIAALGPRRVLEIGCGTGLLLLPLAPACERYVATDFSAATLERLGREVGARGLSQVELLACAADALPEFGPEAFDVVVLNSVVQYFPGAEYLARVLARAVASVRKGGAVFVGDVRNLALLENFHAAVQLERAPETLALDALRQRIDQHVAHEEELLLDPRFFAALARELPAVGRIQMLPKRGRSANELSGYRYDAVLHVGAAPPAHEGRVWTDWRDELGGLAELEALLAGRPRAELCVARIPNARNAASAAALRALARGGLENVGALREQLAFGGPRGVEPEDVLEVAARHAYEAELSLAQGEADGSFDALLWPSEAGAGVRTPPDDGRHVALASPAAYANDPLKDVVAAELAPSLRAYLGERLPEYMLPTAFVVLDGLPLTPSGKVDRDALPEPGTQAAGGAHVAARTPTEEALQRIWASVLGSADVSVTANFFEIGGHSLLATQVMSRVREAFGVELPLRSLFDAPTIAGFALRLDAPVAAVRATARIPRRRRDGLLPLSFGQERLWFLDQMEPGNPFYNGDFAVRLRGPLDAPALGAAIDEVVARHEALRTRFVQHDGSPVQVIDPPATDLLQRADLGGLPPAEREAEALRLALVEASTPFDLERGPVFRANLLRLSADEHVLTLTLHHIVCDWWSIGVFVAEVGACYEARLAGRPAELPPIELQFADYASWQREWLSGAERERQLAYWRERLAGELPLLELPTDRPRPARPAYRGERLDFALDAGLTATLKTLAEREGATLFMVLAAAFDVLLHRYTGQEDVLIGTAIANRTRAELEPLVGFFVNTLVLRARIEDGQTFREALREVKQAALGAYAHQDMPFEQLVEELSPGRDLARAPLFQVFFQLRNAPMPVPDLPGVTVEPVDVDNRSSIFDLTVTMEEQAGRLTGHFRYDADLFERITMQRAISDFEQVLRACAAEPGARVGELRLLPEPARLQLVAAAAGPCIDFGPFEALHAQLERRAAEHPERVALEQGSQHVSYGELNARANRLAHRLALAGAGLETTVALCLQRGPGAVAAILAALKTGAAYLPIDPAFPEERRRSMLAGACAVVCAPELAPSLAGCGAAVVLEAESDGQPGHDLAREVQPEAPAYVLYTSGSTGLPKAVAMSHGALANLVAWQLQDSTPGPARTAQFAPYGFDVSFQELFSTLASGGTLVLLADEQRRDGELLLAEIEEHAVERLFVPFVALELVAEAAARSERYPPCLRDVIAAGEALRVTPAVAALFERLGDCRLHNQYGPTEAHVVSALALPAGRAAAWPEQVPIGRAIANARVHVLDARLEPVPPGVVGELYLGGAGLARGYAGAPALTAERFVPDPFAAGERLYRSGDLGRLRADGTLECLGRRDGQVKLRGVRVELGEVDAGLRALPGVRAAASAVSGERGVKQLVGYVVLEPGAAFDDRDLRRQLSRRLPDVLVPARLVALERLPLTASGKLDRRALPAPPSEAEARPAGTPLPGPLEHALAEIFGGLLGRDVLSAEDDFFELGGHSLLATRAMARVRDQLGVRLPLRALFESPSVGALALRVGEALRAGAQAAELPLEPGDRTQLSHTQERLWFLEQLAPGSPMYAVPLVVRLCGNLDVDALRAALAELARRHEVLRTRYVQHAGRPVAVLDRDASLPLDGLDVSAHPDAVREAQRLAQQEALRGFDLERGPVARGLLVRVGPQEHVLALTVHHIAVDGWSLGVIVRELAAVYAARLGGRPAALPELAVQYADWARWQRAQLASGVLESQLGYWRERLAGGSATELPGNGPRPARPSGSGAQVRLGLSPELRRRLTELGTREGASAFMVLLAGLGVVLARWTGDAWVQLGSALANRGRTEIEPLVGLFVNMAALRFAVPARARLRDVLKNAREAALGAFAHQDAPFERVVEALGVPRDLARTPLFQIAFEYQGGESLAAEAAGLRLAALEVEPATSRFDLTVSVDALADGYVVAATYSTELYERETIERLLQHYERALETLCARPEQTVGQVALLSPAERDRVLQHGKPAARQAPSQTLHGLFERQAAKTPERVAVRCGAEELSYAELDHRANRLARHLAVLGVGPDTRVALHLERSCDLLVALFAVLKAGGAYLPLERRTPRERLAFLLADAEVAVVITGQALLPQLPESSAACVCLDQDAGLIAAYPDAPFDGGAGPESLAYLIYTSGSTGRPKGVMVEHRSIANYVAWALETLGPASGAGALVHSSLAFDLTLTGLLPPLASGSTVTLLSEDQPLEALSAAFQAGSGQSLVKLTPSHLEGLAYALAGRDVAGATRALVIGGEALHGEALRFWRAAAPETRLINHYGPTETTVGCCTYELPAGEVAAGPVPIGRPIAGARLYVLDAQREPVPEGMPGELYIGGAGVARGYARRPGLTAERFLPDPFADTPGARMYASGDRVRLRRDEELEYLGRRDFQVKLRGFRVELGEVEAALGALPQVRDVAVIARAEGAAGARLVAYVVAPDAAADFAASAGEALRARLPEHMLPSAYVRLERLPLTANGKLDRAALPAPEAAAAEGERVPPRTPLEDLLAGAWSELLGVPRVGASDNFFTLGGHSLLAVRLGIRIQELCGVALPLRTLFEAQTVEAQAAAVAAARAAGVLGAEPPLVRVPRDQPLPLSFGQQRLWFLDQLEPGSSLFNVPAAVRLRGRLDVAALQASLDLVLRRHEALRARFGLCEGRPVQTFDGPQGVVLQRDDLTGLPAAEAEAEALRRAEREAAQPFDLAAGPLLRTRLIEIAAQDALLVLTAHHVVSDGWSTGLLVREVAQGYAARVAGERVEPQPLPVQYADYAQWQRLRLEGPALLAQLAYWREQLAGLPVLELPADRARKARPTGAGEQLTFELPGDLAARLRAFGRREGVTLFMTVLGAFAALLQRYTGERDLAIGTDVANRGRAETQGLIGFFLNQLVLRPRVDPRSSFRDLLGQVRARTLEAFANAELPFERLVEELQPARDLGRSPLFQVKLVVQHDETHGVGLPGLELTPVGLPGKTAKHDLTLFVIESGDALHGMLEYSSELFDRARVANLARHFLTLLDGLVAEPERALASVPLLSADERRDALASGHAADGAAPGELCAHELFERQAGRTPEALALRAGAHTLSYAELDGRSNRLARHLREQGVGPEVCVGLCLERGIDAVVALLAVLKAGGAYVPLDPTYPAERLQALLGGAGIAVLVTRAAIEERLPVYWGQTVCLDRDAAAIDAQAGTPLLPCALPDGLAYVLFTSGSTGEPKGVMVPHRGLVNYLTWSAQAYAAGQGTGAPVHSPLGFDLTVTSLLAPLVSGSAVTLLPDEHALDELAAALRGGPRFSLVKLTPSHLQGLAQLLAGRDLTRAAGALVIGGEALGAETLAFWRQAAPATRLINEYGPTEAVVGCCVYELPEDAPTSGPVPIGRPIANTRLYVLDERQEPVPDGVPGELYIGGLGLARGYVGQPGATGARFVPDPFGAEPGERLYRSGDVVRRRRDGELEYLGRNDRQLKLRGHRIEPGEIEAALRAHVQVADACVMARGSSAAERRLVAYVVAAGGSAPEVGELRAFLAERLPAYMMPAAIVALEALPLNAHGKLDRQALPDPGDAAEPVSSEPIAPRSEVEAGLARIWAEVLGREAVGVTESFFDLGGHSLLATGLVHQVGLRFGVEAQLRDLFHAPSVAEFAKLVEARAGAQPGTEWLLPTLVPDPQGRFEPFPLTDIQQAYWIGRSGAFQLSNVSAHGYLELEGSGLDVARLERALRRCIGRHDMLRAVVSADGEQRVLRETPEYAIPVHDLRTLAPAAQQEHLDELRARMSHEVRPADAWPLFEVRLALLPEGRQRFYLSVDALITDGWSLRLLAADLARFYDEPEAELEPLELGFRDYVLAQRALEGGPLYRRSADYWLARVPSLPPGPELPLAKDPADVPEPRFVRRQALLDAERWLRLKQRAARSSVTHSGVLLAAFAEVLAAWSKSRHFVVNLTLFNRLGLHPQVGKLVGDFTTLTLVEVDARERTAFEARARAVQERLFTDLDHRHFGGVAVLRALSRQERAGAATMPVVFTSVLAPESEGQAALASTPLMDFDVVHGISQTPQVWLDAQAAEQEGGLLALTWDAVEELFPAGLLDEMFGAFTGLVERLADDERAWSAACELLPQAQREQRARANATAAPLPEGLLHTGFLAQAAAQPEALAVVGSDLRLSYGELDRISEQVALALRAQGVSRGALVAVVMEKGWEQVAAVLGVLKAGGAYLPISADVPAARLETLIAHSGARVALTQPQVERRRAWPQGLARIVVAESVPGDLGGSCPPADVQPSNLAYVIYTSGSTGMPKGVMIDHAGALNTVADVNARFAVGPRDRVLALSSLGFDLSVYDVFGLLAAGGALVLPDAGLAQDPAHWAALVRREGVTLWNSVPALMDLYADYLDGRPELRPAALRLVLLSGDWIPLALPGRVRALCPAARVVSLGGATEASIWSILHDVEALDPALPSVPYGRPMLNQQFHVLDEQLAPRPIWVPGQLYIGGRGLALGYLNDPERTGASFVSHPRSGERLYRTGDLGRYLPNGEIQFLGREDFQVKVQGYRIELGEIEAALATHPAVRAAVVLAEGERTSRRLAAFVASPDGVEPAELRAHIEARLPAYMLPARLTVLSELPLSANGKLDRRALLALGAGSVTAASTAEPGGPADPAVAAIVARVLGQDEVARGASLLDLGANSIDMVRIVNALERELGFRPRVDEFYRQPSVAWLSAAYARSRAGAPSEPSERPVATTATQAVPLPAEADAAPLPSNAAELAAVARALEQVRGLSADELERLLAQARRRSGDEEPA